MLELMRSTILARGTRPVPLAFGGALAALGCIMAIFDHGRSIPYLCWFYAIAVSTGLIGVDVENGSVQLLLSRPLTRNRYLAGRLLGAGALGLGFSALVLFAGWAIARSALEAWVTVAAETLTVVIWTQALLFFFSTLLPGHADFLGGFGVLIGGFSLRVTAEWWENERATAVVLWLWDNVTSGVWLGGLHPGPAFWTDLTRWASNVLLALVLGVLIFNRKEFSYGSG